MLQPRAHWLQTLSTSSVNQTRILKRKSRVVSAPTGQMSATFIEYGLSSSLPGNVSSSDSSPRLNTPSSPVFGTSRQKRTQRRHRMQRSWSNTIVGPRSTDFLAGLVADRAVERVVDEQELHHAAPRLLHARRLRVHLHAVGDRRVAGDLEL